MLLLNDVEPAIWVIRRAAQFLADLPEFLGRAEKERCLPAVNVVFAETLVSSGSSSALRLAMMDKHVVNGATALRDLRASRQLSSSGDCWLCSSSVSDELVADRSCSWRSRAADSRSCAAD